MKKILPIFLVLVLATPAWAPRVDKPLLGELPDWSLFPQPIGLWLLNEGSGNITRDLSGYNNQGTLQYNAFYGAGKFGSCVILDGTDDEILCGNNSIFSFGTGPYTILAWINRGTSDAESVAGMNQYNPSWSIDAANKLYVYDGGSSDSSFGVVNPGSWYQIGYVRRNTAAGGLKYYINGLEDTTVVTHAGDVDIGTGLEIGHDTPGGSSTYNFTGKIDHVIIWNIALTAQQIKQLYYNPFPWFRRDPIWMYKTIITVGGQVIIISM